MKAKRQVEKIMNTSNLRVSQCEQMIEAGNNSEGIFRLYLSNDFPEYQDAVMQADQGFAYYPDGYLFDIAHNVDGELLTGELYYVGENGIVSVRLMTDGEMTDAQVIYNEFLREILCV